MRDITNHPMVEVPLESVGKDGDTQKDEKEGTLLDLGKRRKRLTEKGVRMNSGLLRQSSAIQDLIYSAKNMVTVEEEIAQFDYIFKQLLLVHQEYHYCWMTGKS